LVYVKVEAFFPKNIKAALKNDPPGAWMPVLPEGCIRLSSGYPDPALVPSQELKAAVARLLDEEQDLPLHYLGSPRMDKLKNQLLTRMAERRMPVKEDELMLTAGACQAIDLIARLFLDEEAVVAVEAPTYMEALEIFQNYTKQIISIPIDENGLQTEKLEVMLQERRSAGLPLPRFLYTIPTFHNPTGTTLSLARRKHLIELSVAYNFFILEDDAYGELGFADHLLSLKALDETGRVLYVGSLSKVVAPGMRIGWIAGSSEVITSLGWFKKDLEHPFAQSTMAAYLEGINLDERLAMLRAVYQKKAEILMAALENEMPKGVTWYVPEGGYFLWVKIPGVDTSDLLTKALVEGVSFIPGKYFYLEGKDGSEYLRLSYSYASDAEMIVGVRKLGVLLSQ
jgi:2-aminoadipate transaminase